MPSLPTAVILAFRRFILAFLERSVDGKLFRRMTLGIPITNCKKGSLEATIRDCIGLGKHYWDVLADCVLATE